MEVVALAARPLDLQPLSPRHINALWGHGLAPPDRGCCSGRVAGHVLAPACGEGHRETGQKAYPTTHRPDSVLVGAHRVILRQLPAWRETVDLSVGIASKLLQRNVSKEDNERLIEETFKQLESSRGR